MSPKQLVRIALVLLAALVLWGVAELFNRQSDKIVEGGILGPVAQGGVTRILIIRPGEDTVLLEQVAASTWRVNGHDANANLVSDLLGAVKDGVRGELVAESPGSHQRMEVDSASGRRLRFLSGETVLGEVIVGKSGPSYGTVYLRPVNDVKVYLARSALGTHATRSVADWRDRTIVDIAADSIGRVTVERGGKRYTLVRGDSAWTFADGGATDSAAVARLLGRFASLTTQGDLFATEAQRDSIDFRRPDARILLMGRSGDTLAALLFDEHEGRYWVQRAGKEPIYQLYSWRVDEIAPADSTLRPKPGAGEQ